jgi:hypothetical protein
MVDIRRSYGIKTNFHPKSVRHPSPAAAVPKRAEKRSKDSKYRCDFHFRKASFYRKEAPHIAVNQ